MKNLKLLKLFALFATLLSAGLTADAAYNVWGWVVALFAFLLLDVNFWVWDLTLHKVTSTAQRYIVVGAMSLWWLLMTYTSMFSGFLNAEASNLWSDNTIENIPILLIAGIANLTIAFYMGVKFNDEEILTKLAQNDFKADVTKESLDYKRDFYEKNAHTVGAIQAQAEILETFKRDFGIDMPEEMRLKLGALGALPEQPEPQPESKAGNNGQAPKVGGALDKAKKIFQRPERQ